MKYYTEWLPQLIDESRSRMNLKCVQPVEWPPESGVAEQLLTWLHLHASPEESKPEAEQLITRVRAVAAPTLRVIRLHELSDITGEDLDEFCELMNLKDHQRTWFLSRISARSPKTAREVFQAIDDYLPDARSLA